MATYIEVGTPTTVLLADNTPVVVKCYDEYDDEENLVAENQLEAQLEGEDDNMYCWHISSTALMQSDTKEEYLEPNSQSQSALPRPKSMPNPGGSPVKY